MLARIMDALFQSFVADPLGSAGQWLEHGFKGASPLVVVLAVALLAAGLWLWRRPGRKARTNVSTRRAFGQAEGQLWSRLTTALPDHVVLMSTSLTRFVAVRQDGGLGSNKRKLEALAVDFAIFRSDGSVSSVVLLEDGDSALTRRQLKLRRKLLDRAGVKMVSWATTPLPTVDMITRQLNPAPLHFSAGESGSAQRRIRVSGSQAGADDALAPDTRLAASQVSTDIRPA